jgi:hypothetical protein
MIISYSPRQSRQKLRFLNLTFFFCMFPGIKKNKNHLYTTFFENTASKLVIAAQTFRVILSITAQPTFAVEPSD